MITGVLHSVSRKETVPMQKFKMLIARLLLTIMVSCTFITDAPLQFQNAPQITVQAATTYNRATIKKVQKKLNKYGYDCGDPDGIAGSKTKKAIKKYQRDNDLTVTSTINAKLLKSLNVKPVKDAPSSSTASQNNQSSVGASDTNELTVYITDTGSKYHRSGCRYLSRSKHAIAKSDAQSRGYDACSVCNP